MRHPRRLLGIGLLLSLEDSRGIMNRILMSVCFLFAACGEVVDVNPSDGDGGTTNDDGGAGIDAGPTDPCVGPSIALEDLVTCFVQAQCEYMARCFPGIPDQEYCESRAFDILAAVSDTDGGGDDGAPNRLFFDVMARADEMNVADYHGDRAFNCLSGIGELACKDENRIPDCEYIMTGTGGAGSVCTDDFECVEGGRCNRDSEQTCGDTGLCEVGLTLGANCSSGSGSCRPELNCIGVAGVPPTCQSGNAGSDCFENRDCNGAFHCGGSSKCVADKATNSTCTNHAECSGNEYCVGGKCSAVDTVGAECEGYCQGNLYCDATMLCKAMPGPGADCSAVPDSPFGQCNSLDLVCGQVTGTCNPRVPSGAPCGGPLTRSCALGTFCESDFGDNNPNCIPPQTIGANCNVSKHCASDHCETTLPLGNLSCQEYVACWEN